MKKTKWKQRQQQEKILYLIADKNSCLPLLDVFSNMETIYSHSTSVNSDCAWESCNKRNRMKVSESKKTMDKRNKREQIQYKPIVPYIS